MNIENHLNLLPVAKLHSEQQQLSKTNPGGVKNQITSEQAIKAAQGFEQIFLTQYLALMNEGVDLPGVDEHGAGSIFKSWLTEAYAKILSDNGTLGVADQILNSTSFKHKLEKNYE